MRFAVVRNAYVVHDKVHIFSEQGRFHLGLSALAQNDGFKALIIRDKFDGEFLAGSNLLRLFGGSIGDHILAGQFVTVTGLQIVLGHSQQHKAFQRIAIAQVAFLGAADPHGVRIGHHVRSAGFLRVDGEFHQFGSGIDIVFVNILRVSNRIAVFVIHGIGGLQIIVARQFRDVYKRQAYTVTLKVTKGDPELKLSDTSKLYDGTAAAVTVESKSDAKVDLTWYDAAGKQLDRAPIDPGKYSVQASVQETTKYMAQKVKADYTIEYNDHYFGVEGFVTRLYSVALGREPEQEGYTKWVNGMKSKEYTCLLYTSRCV